MLSDPRTINYGMSLASTGGVASAFRRTSSNPSKFHSTTGAFSTDQPARMTVTSNVVLQGPSKFRVRLETDKNVAPINGIQQKDDTAFADLSFGGNLRSFTQTDLINLIAALCHSTIVDMPFIANGES